MGYSYKDVGNGMKNVSQNINDKLEENSKRKGEKLANDVASGSGFFGFYISIPGMIFAFAMSALLMGGVFNIQNDIIIFIIGLIGAVIWRNLEYTKQHIFKSTGIITVVFIVALTVADAIFD